MSTTWKGSEMTDIDRATLEYVNALLLTRKRNPLNRNGDELPGLAIAVAIVDILIAQGGEPACPTKVTYRRADGEAISGEYDYVEQLEWFESDYEPTELIKETWTLTETGAVRLVPPGWVEPIRCAACGCENDEDNDNCLRCGTPLDPKGGK
jgi:hypothetical protein